MKASMVLYAIQLRRAEPAALPQANIYARDWFATRAFLYMTWNILL